MLVNDRNFLFSRFGRILLIGFISAVAVSAAIVHLSWQQLQNNTYSELENIHRTVTVIADDRLSQIELMLKMLSERTTDVYEVDGIDGASRIMNDLLQGNKVFAGYGIVTPQGDVVYSSDNVNPGAVPNLLTLKGSARTFQKTLDSHRVTLGDTYFSEAVQKWRLIEGKQ